jgi:hypothetical protein
MALQIDERVKGSSLNHQPRASQLTSAWFVTRVLHVQTSLLPVAFVLETGILHLGHIVPHGPNCHTYSKWR